MAEPTVTFRCCGREFTVSDTLPDDTDHDRPVRIWCTCPLCDSATFVEFLAGELLAWVKGERR